VEQAILALVDNAVKYGPEEQRVTIESTCSEGELRVEVQAYRRQDFHTSSSASTGWPESRSQEAASR
jgi:hypothetical protein